MADPLKDEYRQVHFRCDQAVLPTSFFIVTAHNPDGTTVDAEANQRADEELRAEIRHLGYEAFGVTGGNADFTHAEPGWGFPCTREEALSLARRFRQDAVFEIREGQVILISALESPTPDEAIGAWGDLVTMVD